MKIVQQIHPIGGRLMREWQAIRRGNGTMSATL